MDTPPAADLSGATPWGDIEGASNVTADMALGAVTAMEISRGQHLDAHLPAARRIAAVADELGRPDLKMRALLIMADIAARKGAPMKASKDIQTVIDWAARAGDTYITARSSFVQCIVQYSIGDVPAARLHGINGVELLQDDTPIPIRIDHLSMLAVAYGPGPQADQCYRYALDLTAQTGDTEKSIGIHNNLAFFACQVGDVATALEHVEQILTLSTLNDIFVTPSILDTVATVYISAGRFADAVFILEPAVAEGSPRHGSIAGVQYTEPYSIPVCLLTLAHAHRSMGSLDEAQRCIDRALKLASNRGLGRIRANALQEQARLYAARGDWRAAYKQHIAFHDKFTQFHAAAQESRAEVVQASHDTDERRRDTVRFRELAMRDALTGLYNRRFIDEQLKSLTTQAAFARTPLSAAIADADFFKRINDECSHDVGDQVLRTMSTLLAGAVVAPETVGRLGGEEFVILMPNASVDEALARCEEIRVTIAMYDWTTLVGAIPVTVSIGVATAADGQTSPAAILSDADRNLYAAKRSGRNKVVSDLD